MVINVVKNASHPKPATFHRPRTGSVSAFQLVRIVTLTGWLCKGFFASTAPQMLRGNKQMEVSNPLSPIKFLCRAQRDAEQNHYHHISSRFEE